MKDGVGGDPLFTQLFVAASHVALFLSVLHLSLCFG